MRAGKSRFLLFILTTALGASFLERGLFAQDSGPHFDVTSVKRDTLDPRARTGRFDCLGTRFAARGPSIESLLVYAYPIERFQLSGLPAWATEEVYDIEARANGELTETLCRQMLRALFVDRFKLTIRREAREVPVLALVIDKDGPKIHKVAAEDGINGPGFVINGTPMQMFDPGLKGWTMAQLTKALTIAQLGAPIVDKTGLEGQYRISLTFDQRGTTDGKAPDVTTALREQLGLRLESQRANFDFFVITRMERPDKN